MKKINFYILFIALFFSVSNLYSQVNSNRVVRADQVKASKEGDNVIISMNLNLRDLDLGSQEMIIVTPVVNSTDNMYSHSFQPIVITGGTREKALHRAMNLDNYRFEIEPRLIMRHHKNSDQNVPLTLNIPYQDWLRDATLSLDEYVIGCACENLWDTRYPVLTPLLPPLFIPNFQYSYITPPVEPVKQRSETHSAHLNFIVGKYNILRDFKDNARVLDEVDKIISEIRNDKDLSVTDFTITGYASPEGNPQSNMKLSENRARSFVSYLVDRYSIPSNTVITNWKGEDWDGLRKIVQGLNISDKSEVLAILDEPNVATRKRRLQQFSGGETYRMLLRDHYPKLRRNDYTISYVARNFTIEEAKELIRTKPQHLSQNEMFLVANTYPKDSKEFKEIFDIAIRIYPDSPISQINAATLEVERGAYDTAIRKLEIMNTPEAWNNLGIAYAMKKDYERARQYFERAASAGLGAASINRNQIIRVINDL